MCLFVITIRCKVIHTSVCNNQRHYTLFVAFYTFNNEISKITAKLPSALIRHAQAGALSSASFSHLSAFHLTFLVKALMSPPTLRLICSIHHSHNLNNQISFYNSCLTTGNPSTAKYVSPLYYAHILLSITSAWLNAQLNHLSRQCLSHPLSPAVVHSSSQLSPSWSILLRQSFSHRIAEPALSALLSLNLLSALWRTTPRHFVAFISDRVIWHSLPYHRLPLQMSLPSVIVNRKKVAVGLCPSVLLATIISLTLISNVGSYAAGCTST